MDDVFTGELVSNFVINGTESEIVEFLADIAKDIPHHVVRDRTGYHLEIDCDYCTVIFHHYRERPDQIVVGTYSKRLGVKMGNKPTITSLILQDVAQTVQKKIEAKGYHLSIA